MFSLWNVRAQGEYRAGAQPALELGFELSARCRDVRRVWARIDVVESYRVRAERAAESAAPKWDDEDVELRTVSAELSPDPDAPSLWVGTLAQRAVIEP